MPKYIIIKLDAGLVTIESRVAGQIYNDIDRAKLHLAMLQKGVRDGDYRICEVLE